MRTRDTDPVPDELLEQRATDIVEGLAHNEYQALEYFSETKRPDIIESWDTVADIYGSFGGLKTVRSDPELDEDVDVGDDERVVEVTAQFGEEPFKIHIFFAEYGDPTGFYLIRDKELKMSDTLTDAGRIAQLKVSSVSSLLGGSSDALTDRERDVATAVVDELDNGDYQRVYNRCYTELQGQLTVAEIESGWTEYAADLDGIGDIRKKDDVVAVSLDTTEGDVTLFLSVTEDGELGTLRIRDL